MAVEPRRECNYRKVGGLYLIGEGFGAECDRLPLAITPCACCGEEPRFTRGIAQIDPYALWGPHEVRKNPIETLHCAEGHCPICDPVEQAFLMWVGSEYTVDSFSREARTLGISKRVPFIPNNFVVGTSWVFLAKQRIIPNSSQGWMPGMAEERRGFGPGVFTAFRPSAIELVLDQSEVDAESDRVREAREKGVTIVGVPDDDPDHHNTRKTQAPEGSTAEV